MNSGGDVAKDLGVLLHVGQAEFDAGKAAGEKLKEMGGTTGALRQPGGRQRRRSISAAPASPRASAAR